MRRVLCGRVDVEPGGEAGLHVASATAWGSVLGILKPVLTSMRKAARLNAVSRRFDYRECNVQCNHCLLDIPLVPCAFRLFSVG